MAVTVTPAFSIRPERVEDFKNPLKDLLPDTRASESCRRVDVYQDQDNPGYVHLVEDWDSKGHRHRHQSWRDETEIAETLGPFLAGEPRFNRFDKADIQRHLDGCDQQGPRTLNEGLRYHRCQCLGGS